MYKLKAWVDVKKVHKSKLSKNPLAMEYFEQHPKQINWNGMSENPSPKAIALLEQNLDKVNWKLATKNPGAVHLLAKHPENIVWKVVYENPNFMVLFVLLEKIPGQVQKFDWYEICKSPTSKSSYLLNKYPHKADWKGLSENPGAIKILNRHPEKIHYPSMFKNQNAIHFIQKNPNQIYNYKYLKTSKYLSSNPGTSMLQLLETYSSMIDIYELSKNPNPTAIDLLEKNIYKVRPFHWVWISENPNAVPLLEKNPDKIYLDSLYMNPNAEHLLEKHSSRIPKWEKLAKNPNPEMVGRITEKHNTRVEWKYMSDHPCIFELDYAGLRKRCGIFKEDLIKVCMHPSKIQRLLDMGYEIEDLEDLM